MLCRFVLKPIAAASIAPNVATVARSNAIRALPKNNDIPHNIIMNPIARNICMFLRLLLLTNARVSL